MTASTHSPLGIVHRQAVLYVIPSFGPPNLRIYHLFYLSKSDFRTDVGPTVQLGNSELHTYVWGRYENQTPANWPIFISNNGFPPKVSYVRRNWIWRRKKNPKNEKERRKSFVRPLLLKPAKFQLWFRGCESTKYQNLACGRGAVLKSMSHVTTLKQKSESRKVWFPFLACGHCLSSPWHIFGTFLAHFWHIFGTFLAHIFQYWAYVGTSGHFKNLK